MSKRNRGFTRDKYEKWVKDGRGSGAGAEYKPWITIQDVPSIGRETRVHGIKINRQHELLSDNERNYFYILEYSNRVTDIREQYPLLPIEQTIMIADGLGVKHPTDPSTGESTVVTTDFLVTVYDNKNSRLLARTIKSTDDLNNERQIEKFEIERRYWEIKNVDWGVVTEKEINEVLTTNISIVRPFYSLEGIMGFENLSTERIAELIGDFKKEIVGQGIIVREVARRFEEDMLLEHGIGIALFKHLLITKQITIDLLKKLDVDIPQEIKLCSNSYM